MKRITLYLGLDVHKDSITIAIAPGTPQGEIHLHGTITNDLHALEKALSRIRKAPGPRPVPRSQRHPLRVGTTFREAVSRSGASIWWRAWEAIG